MQLIVFIELHVLCNLQLNISSNVPFMAEYQQKRTNVTTSQFAFWIKMTKYVSHSTFSIFMLKFPRYLGHNISRLSYFCVLIFAAKKKNTIVQNISISNLEMDSMILVLKTEAYEYWSEKSPGIYNTKVCQRVPFLFIPQFLSLANQ